MTVRQAGVVLYHEDLQLEEFLEEIDVFDLLWRFRRFFDDLRRVLKNAFISLRSSE